MAFDYLVLISNFNGGVAPVSWAEVIARIEADAGITTALEEPKFKWTKYDGTEIAFIFVSEPSGAEKTLVDGHAAASPSVPVATKSTLESMYEQTRDPDENDDADDGFVAKDFWFNTASGDLFVCVSNTNGSAKWKWITFGGLKRASEITNLGIALQTDDESNPASGKVLQTDGAGDFTLVDLPGGTVDTGYFVSEANTDTAAGPDDKINQSPTLVGGTYRVHWCTILSATGGNTDIDCAVNVDGNLVDSWQQDSPGSSGNEFSFSGFVELALSSGTRQFQITIEKTGGTGSASIRRTRIRYERIGA